MSWASRPPHQARYSTDTVESIARAVGYSSEYAFNRAFARHRGRHLAATAAGRSPRPRAERPDPVIHADRPARAKR